MSDTRRSSVLSRVVIIGVVLFLACASVGCVGGWVGGWFGDLIDLIKAIWELLPLILTFVVIFGVIGLIFGENNGGGGGTWKGGGTTSSGGTWSGGGTFKD